MKTVAEIDSHFFKVITLPRSPRHNRYDMVTAQLSRQTRYSTVAMHDSYDTTIPSQSLRYDLGDTTAPSQSLLKARCAMIAIVRFYGTR